jgi:methionyl-tRNA synthetase
LLGKKIIVAYNLKPAKLRGIESRGMLLAAGDKIINPVDNTETERVEVLDAGDTPTGTRFLPEDIGSDPVPVPPAEINIDTFFSYKIYVKDYDVLYGVDRKKLCLNGKSVRTSIISEGEVH